MEDYNEDYNINDIIVPSSIIDKVIRSKEGRKFCYDNNIPFYVSCGWVCVTV